MLLCRSPPFFTGFSRGFFTGFTKEPFINTQQTATAARQALDGPDACWKLADKAALSKYGVPSPLDEQLDRQIIGPLFQEAMAKPDPVERNAVATPRQSETTG